MRNINSITLSGNIVRDPEISATKAGTQVMSFTVAVNDQRRNQQTGEYEDDPSFIKCSLYGKRAGSLVRMVGKGTFVVVCGKLRQERWKANDGTNRTTFSVVVDEINFRGAQDRSYTSPDVYDDDCPF